MDSTRIAASARWSASAVALAAIVAFDRLVLHANPTTVALTLLLLILFIAANWGLRYAIVTSVVAAVAYNFFFLPPVDTFVVSDPQNGLALVVFLITAVFASRSSDRIREESLVARRRQGELEVLYQLSGALLRTDELGELTRSIPLAVTEAAGARGVVLYLLDGERRFHSGDPSGAEWPNGLSAAELKELAHGTRPTGAETEAIVPLRTGVRPRGVLLLRGVQLSLQTLDALGGLVSVSLDRARAVEEASRAQAGKESERLRGFMLDSITHELRTPLTSIKGAISSLLAVDTNLSHEASREMMAVIDEESDRLNRLIAQAVEMAQLDAQEVRMSPSPQVVENLIQDSVEATRTIHGTHRVSARVAPCLPRVEADPAWISKLLGNLLENAVKYSSPGTPIVVSADADGSFVTISVADQGPGIQPAEQLLIFEKFYRGRGRSQGASGTGMGLAICKAIAEHHGGSISVTSRVGEGSVFRFSLRALDA